MGLIRVLLAAAVVLVHAGGFFRYNITGGGQIAVQMFYMISGFYMALVLTEKYSASPVGFYVNRALRLFPTYWVVCAGALLLYGIVYRETGGGFFGALAACLPHASWPLISWTVFSNVSLFGLDWLDFGGMPRLVPPAWTLGVEITFYILAPLIVRQRLGFLIALLGVSGALRFAAYLEFRVGAEGTFWAYQFFPFELALFLAGVLAFRLYQRIKETEAGRWLGFSLIPGIVLFQIIQKIVTTSLPGSNLALVSFWIVSFAYLAAAMPFLFRDTRMSTLDTRIGALSYPLYLVHFPLFQFYSGLVDGGDSPLSRAIRSIVVLLVSLALASALARFVESKVDRRRHRLGDVAFGVVAADSRQFG